MGVDGLLFKDSGAQKQQATTHTNAPAFNSMYSLLSQQQSQPAQGKTDMFLQSQNKKKDKERAEHVSG